MGGEISKIRGVIDKSEWGDGPWMAEPDKVQWQDAATGLPCLAVRAHMGSWCGYVGVGTTHPAHGLHYDGEPATVAEARREVMRKQLRANLDLGKPLEELPAPPQRQKLSAAGEKVAELEVHGGVTFADECADTRREAWEVFRLKLEGAVREAHRFPKGDAARFLKEWSGCFDDYERWVERVQATAICHVVPGPGEPDDIWWFGFDCGHALDFQPAIVATLLSLSQTFLRDYRDEVYRDLDYVRGECARLAAQLAAIG